MLPLPADATVIEDPGGPYVLAALICHRISDAPETNVATYHDVLDRLIQYTPAAEHRGRMAPMSLHLRFGIKLAAGRARRGVPLRLLMIDSDDAVLGERVWPLTFTASEETVSYSIAMTCDLARPGVYWYVLLYGERILTKVPLSILVSSEPHDQPSCGPAPA